MKKIDSGTLIRTIALFVTLLNQMFAIFGVEQLPITEDQISLIVELNYQIVSTVATLIATLVAWWKNNSFTKEAQLADQHLKQMKEGK